MHRNRFFILIAMTLALPVSLFSAAQTLLENGGFETGAPEPWVFIGNGSLISIEARTGNHAGYLADEGDSMQQTITGLSPDTTYTLSGWAKIEEFSSGSVVIGVKEYGGPTLDGGVQSQSYKRVTHTFTTGPSSTSAVIYCYRNPGGQAFCDDFELIEVVPEEPAERVLIWSEEFDGSVLDESIWSYELGYIRNQELQTYTSNTKNVRVENGYLILEAHEESVDGYAYTSGSIESIGKFDFQYGRVDVRAALPISQGMWPAVWTLGSNFPQVNWPHSGEIDIMEHISTENLLHGTIHFSDSDQNHQSIGNYTAVNAPDLEAFNIYSIEWDPQEIRWYLDDVQFASVDITAADMTEFHQPHYLKLNLAVGGAWAGAPDGTTVFPAQYLIDYVRVYAFTDQSIFLPLVVQ